MSNTDVPPAYVPAPPKLPRRPDQRVYRDLPIALWTDWNVPDVRDALASHVLGNFARSAQLADAALGDDRVQSVVSTRVLGMLGLPFEVAPAEGVDPRKARRAARELEEIWWDVCPAPQTAEFLSWAIMLGFALAEVVWTSKRGRWWPTLRTWHPQLVYYRLDKRCYVVFTQDGAVDVEPGNGKWILYAPRGAYRGWMAGAVRAVAIPWLVRQYAHRDWARYSEAHGMPIKGAKVPATASESDKNNFYLQIANMGTETTIQLPQGLDGQSFGIDLIEAAAGNWEAFDRLITKCDTNIACAILGQNLSTEVQGGSFAAAGAHQQVRQDYLEADAETLATALHSQLLRPWAAFNFGNPDLAPWPSWDATPPEDRKEAAATLQAFADAVAKLLSSGVPIDIRALAERFDIPLLDTEQPVALGALDPTIFQYGIMTVNEARARLRLPPIAGGDTIPVVSAASAPSVGAAALPADAHAVHLGRPARGVPRVDAQRYVDALADRARARAARLLGQDVASVLSAVQNADSFDAVREGLRRVHEQMDPSAFANLTSRAITMAGLAGRTAVQQEL
ncbi:DUF935 domain-containing protein [Pendulispora brunnea]|uniref:DUF935 domain-containing protein n=1 Tax=Pendulispora brunnea TaxID=2905690 RepID=A0ABZ2KBU8_9BACT